MNRHPIGLKYKVMKKWQPDPLNASNYMVYFLSSPGDVGDEFYFTCSMDSEENAQKLVDFCGDKHFTRDEFGQFLTQFKKQNNL